jgi:L-lysine exporter family protein LysE/ArgO
MIEITGSAILAGILLSLGFGSVFFALIQTSIENGFKNAVKIALGVCFGDFLLILAAIMGSNLIPENDKVLNWIKFFGAILLLSIAISQFKPSKISTKIKEYKFLKFLYFFLKGLLLNVLNPINFVSWLVYASALKSYGYSKELQIYALVTTVITIFVSESAIALFAYKIKNYLSEKSILKLKTITGVIFLVLSAKLFYDSIGFLLNNPV